MAGAGDTSSATIAACATATGGSVALLRLSGPRAFTIAQAAGASKRAGGAVDQLWRLAGGTCPVRILSRRGPATATGEDLVELLIPGAADLVELALAALVAAGATRAGPGAFTRQALAAGRVTLDQAEGLLAVAQAPDAPAAADALTRLRGALAGDLGPVRARLLALRAEVEAGLDFLDEHDVRPADRRLLAEELQALEQRIRRWVVAADGLGGAPVICLVGAPNAGKSALFAALTGEAALVSPVAGTTRDSLHGQLTIAGRGLVRVVDTPGWLDDASGLDAAALAAGALELAGATIVLACAAPDAPLPAISGMENQRMLVIATKSDLGLPADPRAVLSVSATTGAGLAALHGLLARRLAPVATAEPRQQRLLAAAADDLAAGGRLVTGGTATDDLLAEDLRRAGEHLGELLGPTTPDTVLDAIFARFCIGK